MIDKYVLATNDDGDLAIRTVSATESSSVTDTTSVITATDDGKLAVRVVGGGGGGGGDEHNLGWYATPQALTEAHPTATAGDWAIVGSTDTVWLWDTDNEEWVDSDTKGQVTSVNNQTGAVTLDINDVAPTQTGKSGYVLGTDGFVAGWVKPEIVQVSALPTASADEVDNIYQFVGTTDANYTNGYFYKCVSDGQTPATYSWTQTDVQPAPSGLPDQTGQSGKFLTTDGTDASWSDKPLVNTATQPDTGALGILANVTGYEALGIKTNKGLGTRSITIGNGSETQAGSESEMAIGRTAKAYGAYACAIGNQANAYGANCHAIGYNATAGDYRYYSTYGAWQFGSGTNSEAGTVCFALTTSNDYQHWTNYKLLDSDGTIPTDRFTTTPVADGTYVPTLTISSGTATRTWAAPGGGGSTALSLTLAAANWSNNTITVTATGVTASNNVIVSPAPASQSAYTTAGVMCTAQASDSLIFTCTTTPSSDLTVTVLII